MNYLYDASGNRVGKRSFERANVQNAYPYYPQQEEFYLCDATGNILTTFMRTNSEVAANNWQTSILVVNCHRSRVVSLPGLCSTQSKLKNSIDNTLKKDNEKRHRPIEINYNCEIVLSKDTPELSIVDYMLWALQRYILKGEKRFYNALQKKYDLILDLYDFENRNHNKAPNFYSQKNIFELAKAGEFRNDGYV